MPPFFWSGHALGAEAKTCQFFLLERKIFRNYLTFKVRGGKKVFQCHICGANLSKNHRLKEHIATVHEGQKPFHCDRDKCEAKFAHKFSLKHHISSFHEKRKPYTCETCGDTFSGLGHLKRHQKTVHEGIKPFKCEICGKGYTQRTHLNVHVLTIHEGIKLIRTKPPKKYYTHKNSASTEAIKKLW